MEQVPPDNRLKAKLGPKQILIVVLASIWPAVVAVTFAALDAEGPLPFALVALLTMPVGLGLVLYLGRQRS